MVVAPTNLEDQVAYAVADLTNYLARMTGQAVRLLHTNAVVPGAIHVGELDINRDLTAVIEADGLGRDGFVLDVSATSGVRILGGSKFGTAYGVYELLERLGVRWLAPGAWGEVVPDLPVLELPDGRFTNRPRIHIANRGAVVKAGSALQHLHPMHQASLFFFVPRGTRTFTVVAKADEPLTLEVHGPPDAPEPVLPRTMQRSKRFEEHVIEVPPGADGCVWRIQLRGEDKKIFLQGVPPFLASHPERLLVPPP